MCSGFSEPGRDAPSQQHTDRAGRSSRCPSVSGLALHAARCADAVCEQTDTCISSTAPCKAVPWWASPPGQVEGRARSPATACVSSSGLVANPDLAISSVRGVASAPPCDRSSPPSWPRNPPRRRRAVTALQTQKGLPDAQASLSWLSSLPARIMVYGAGRHWLRRRA